MLAFDRRDCCEVWLRSVEVVIVEVAFEVVGLSGASRKGSWPCLDGGILAHELTIQVCTRPDVSNSGSCSCAS